MDYQTDLNKLKSFLESFESSYEFEKIGEDNYLLKYSFYNRNKERIIVYLKAEKSDKKKEVSKSSFKPYEPNSKAQTIGRKGLWDSGSKIEVLFRSENGLFSQLTNSQDVFKVLKTVYEIVKTYIQRYKKKNGKFDSIIYFSPISKNSEDETDPQRGRIYNKMIEKLAKKEFPDLNFKKEGKYFFIS